MFPSQSLTALFAGATFFLASKVQAAENPTYVQRAAAGIESLNKEFYDVSTGIWGNAWWNSANMLTTLADFATLQLDVANKLNIGGYMRNTFTQAQKTTVVTTKSIENGMVRSTYCFNGDKGCMTKRDFLGKRGFEDFLNEFYDDEGWWALGLIRSYDAAGDEDFLEAAVDIFNDMQTGAGTPCGGGIYWKKDRQYVSAISNELYLSVAASLARRIPGNGTYLEIAKNQWEWFKKSGMINSKNLVNDGLNPECKNNGQPTWSYNQGVVLGGLVELAAATGDCSLLDEAKRIAKAAIETLANDDGILVEVDKCELKEHHCGNDGKQFKGIFVRNLRYLHQASPEEEFKTFILTNADSIWENNRNEKNLFGTAWQGPVVDVIANSHSSALDVLVAAVAVA